MENNLLQKTMNRLSENSKEVNSFAIDVWSNYYCYSKSVSGKSIRFWNKRDEGIIEEGILSNEEKTIKEDETANKILELAVINTTIQFEQIKNILKNNKVEILK